MGFVRIGCCNEPKLCDVFWKAVYGWRCFKNTSGVSPVLRAVNGFFTDLLITPTGSYWYGCRMLLKKLSTNVDLMSVMGLGEYGAWVISVLYSSGDGGAVGKWFAPPGIVYACEPKFGEMGLPWCKWCGIGLVAPLIRRMRVLMSCVSTFFKKKRWNRDDST